MREFKLNNEYSVVCQSLPRRGGFKHTATLLYNGNEVASTKITYINRTWESFEYQSVLAKLITENFKGSERLEFLDKVNS